MIENKPLLYLVPFNIFTKENKKAITGVRRVASVEQWNVNMVLGFRVMVFSVTWF